MTDEEEISLEEVLKMAYPNSVVNGKINIKLLWNSFNMPTKLLWAESFKNDVPDARKLIKARKSALKAIEKKFGKKIENPDTLLLIQTMMHELKEKK